MIKKIGLVSSLLRISFFIYILCCQTIFAQTFTNDRDKFVKECHKTFVEADMEQTIKNDLPSIMSTSVINSVHLTKMVDGANAIMLEKNDLRIVYFFISSILYQQKNKFPSDFNATWSGLEKEFRKGDDTKYADFMAFSYSLFRYKALFSDDQTQWVFKGGLEWNQDKKLKIICTEGQLIGFSQNLKNKDSVYVNDTYGVFDVETKKFSGRNGTVSWQKVGFPRTETFAELRGYRVDMHKVILKSDTVSLTTPFFPIPILGVLIDKSLDELKEGEGAPQFNSFEKRLKINELREQMDYDGGFSLEGSRFVGRGVEGNPAKLHYKNDGKVLFTISSLNFTVDPNQILARKSALKMVYPNGDSLIQTDCMFQFDDAKNEMYVTASKKGNISIPFIDYHYKLRCNAPVLKWEQGTPYPKFTFELATSQEQKIIQFESFDFFDDKLYSKLQGMGKGNPLSQIAAYAKKNNLTVISEGQASNALGTTIDYAKTTLLELASLGFIEYQTFDKKIIIQSKLFDFVDAKNGIKDYDNMTFVCDLNTRNLMNSSKEISEDVYLQELQKMYTKLNARFSRQDFFAFIDLKKDQLFLTGVNDITISNAQSSYLQPDSTYVIVKPNRDLIFNGKVYAGKFYSEVSDAYFSYKDFKMKIEHSKYAGLIINPIKSEDGDQPIPLVNSFANLKGEILFDQPSSRNGKGNENSNFPKLLIPNVSKVVYNDPSIVKGAYDSSRFYYKLDPFELDSLDNFNDLALRLKGELISGGIFPPISESLRIMNDYSFGFSTQAPEGGLAFYGENSKYENKIILSHNGLQGAGTINYSSASAVSKKLTFLPDSTIGIAQFVNKENAKGILVPEVKSEAAYITFIPKKQILKASSWKGVNLELFHEQCSIDGSVILSTSGMSGSGTILFPDATLFSRDFKFTNQEINSDTSSFALKNKYLIAGEAPIALETEGVKANVSFKTRKGEFNSYGTKRIKFPPNQYYCTMDKFYWYMDKEDIDLEKSNSQQTTFEAGADLNEPNFFSMHDDQDTLQFRSLQARYDLKLQTIFCNKVEYIRVGDAKIFPDSLKVTVRKYAVMDTLFNATIVAPYITKFHTFTNADINVTSRKKYEGKASYPYYDRDSVLTVLPIYKIQYLNSATVAEGEVKQTSHFKLSSEFDYFGNIKIVAASPGIYCEGSTRINHNCNSFDRSWLSFKDTILAKNIQIPISTSPLNDKGTRLAVGFLWKDSESMDSVKVYPAFLSKIQGKEDPIVFQSSGYVQYNLGGKSFQIASKSRLNGDDEIGNLLVFYTETCSLDGFGKIDFGVNLGEVQVQSFGDINFNPQTNKIKMELTTLLKFPMQKDVFEYLGSSLKDLEGQKAVDLKSKKINFQQYAGYFLNQDKTNDLFKDYEEDKLRKLPDGLEQSIVLSGLKFEYAQFKTKTNESGFARGWVTRTESTEVDTEGDEVKSKNRVAIIGMEGKPVLKDVVMDLVVSQGTNETATQGISFKFSNSANKDYLFDYSMVKKDGKLLVFSNDAGLKTLVTEMKPDKRKSKNFEFDWSDESNVKLILLKFNEYLRSK